MLEIGNEPSVELERLHLLPICATNRALLGYRIDTGRGLDEQRVTVLAASDPPRTLLSCLHVDSSSSMLSLAALKTATSPPQRHVPGWNQTTIEYNVMR